MKKILMLASLLSALVISNSFGRAQNWCGVEYGVMVCISFESGRTPRTTYYDMITHKHISAEELEKLKLERPKNMQY